MSQAAAEIGCAPNAMLYQVRRMLDVDLLRITKTRQRAGRPIKIYRSTHDGYFVPNGAMHYNDLRHRVNSQEQRLSEQVIDAYTAVLFRSRNSGLCSPATTWATCGPVIYPPRRTIRASRC